MTYTQAMSFLDICTEVQSLRFDADQSASIKRWVNDRYAALWNAEEWVFKYAQANVTATTGSNQLTGLPSDFGMPIGIWRADGMPLKWMPPKAYENLYAGSSDTGAPTFYTVINGAVLVGPTSNETSNSYLTVYEKRLTNLVNDTDTPAIPAQHHYLLVVGALSLGLTLFNDFTWQFMEQRWQEGIAEMKQEWLVDQRGDVAQWGRDDVEALPGFWGI